MDNALKAISKTDDELRVGNYIVLFGGRDLEGIATPNKNADGTRGEFFTADTQLESRYTKAGRLPVDWEHGNAPEGEDVGVLGFVDWSTAKADERGLFVERVLNRRQRYVQFLEELIDAGMIGTSSEADPQSVEKADDGRITRWSLVADTLTVSPMEPRMLSTNALQAAKALGLVAEQPEPEDAPEGAASVGASVKAAPTESQTIQEDEMTITEERLAEMLGGFKEEVITASKAHTDTAIEAFKAAQPAPSAGHVVQDGLDNQASDPELPAYKSLGEQLQDVAKAYAPGARPSARLLKAHKAVSGHSEGVAADGGFAVGTDQAGELLRPIYDTSPLMSGMRRYTISSNSNSLSLWGINETSRATGSRYGGVRAYRVAEGDDKTASKMGLRDIRLELHTVAVAAYATDELLQDAALLGQVIGEAARNELQFFMADDVIRGTGAGMPTGILNAASLVTVVKEVGQAADSVVAENILKMWVRMPPRNRANAAWYFNQEVEPELQQMSIGVGTGGQLVYMPPGGLSASPYASIFGRPAMAIEHMEELGTVGDIGLFDMSQYLWAEKGGIQSAASIHVRFLNDEMTYRFTVRYDGQPGWSSALTPYQGTATTGTLSPFVVLASRA